jgi:glycosyltransferase involved in cell wall biosynthesis
LNKKIFFWAPLLGHVGTINAVLHSAISLKRYGNADVYVLDSFGQLCKFNSAYPSINFIKIFNLNDFLPKTGILSKISIYFFSILSIPIFLKLMRKYEPDFLIVNLVGVIPLILKPFLKKNCKIINSIQGYPKLNYFRKILWKWLYRKSNLLITMSNLTRTYIINQININEKKIVKINNPVISRQIRLQSKEKISKDVELLMNNNFCITLVGRLTRQKNYMSFLKVLKKLNKEFGNLFIIIIGEGELRKDIENFLDLNKINNVKLTGFEKNPYKYISRSKLFVSCSLWEDPGHALIEATYLNVPVLTSDCLSGPKEIFINNKNAFVYESGNEDAMHNQLKYILNNYEKTKNVLFEAKKITKNYTYYNFFKSLNNYCKFI